MTVETLTGRLEGYAHPALEEIVERLEGFLAEDEGTSFQIAAYKDGELILDAHGGGHLGADSLMVPFSVSKNISGITIGLLIERGLLDLDALVASYWPEFAAAGKESVTVRQLLSHQAGLPESLPKLTLGELLDHHAGAARLAASWPLWRPGTAFGYHALTIGTLVDELVFRVTGDTLHDYYERELRAPLGVDFYLGLPPELEHRRVDTLPMLPPEGVEMPPMPFNPTRDLAFAPAAADFDLANDPRSWRFGQPGASATASAHGIATLLAAAVTGVGDAVPLLSADTVARIGEQQVRGTDEVLGLPDRSHGIVFQKPSGTLAWGGPRSFGHDGAAGGVGCVDPETGVAFGFTIARGVWPGGGDARAIRIARELGALEL